MIHITAWESLDRGQIDVLQHQLAMKRLKQQILELDNALDEYPSNKIHCEPDFYPIGNIRSLTEEEKKKLEEPAF